MVRHYIIMASSYRKKTRIALDYIYRMESKVDIKIALEKIRKECGDEIAISTHSIMAETQNWDSVLSADPFFQDVLVLDSIDEFIMYANQERNLAGIEVGYYLLSKLSCTHLKLEKLVYLCYAEYLCRTNKKLFHNKIFAFKYGPVVEDVFSKYQYSGESLINSGEDKIAMSLKSRILNSEDGLEKLYVINDIVRKYGDLSSSTLVSITHRANSPWETVYDGSSFKEIPNEIIQSKHCFEE